MNLPPQILRRITARCVARARRWRKRGISRMEEILFFSGAMAVISCFRDEASKALCDDWVADIAKKRAIGDQSPEAQAARAVERKQRAELRELF